MFDLSGDLSRRTKRQFIGTAIVIVLLNLIFWGALIAGIAYAVKWVMS